MYLRTNNKSLCYRLRAHLLEMTEEEKTLGILASHRITINYQSTAVARSPVLTGAIFLVQIREN